MRQRTRLISNLHALCRFPRASARALTKVETSAHYLCMVTPAAFHFKLPCGDFDATGN
jgi:hypothetical protein